MASFFKTDIVVNRSRDELLSELSALTIISCDRKNYGKKSIFRGSVWQHGFDIALNTYYLNSFQSQAVGSVKPIGESQCLVRLSIGCSPLVLVIMAIWNFGLLFAIAAVSADAFYDGIAKGLGTMMLFIPFLAIDFLFLRFALYGNYKKLKHTILEILESKRGGKQ